MLGKTTTLQIRTPEGVAFNLPLASPVSRAIAVMLDLAVIVATYIFLNRLLSLFSEFFASLPLVGGVFVDFNRALLIILAFVLLMFYGAILEWLWKGQTIGKRVMGLRVIDERGLSLDFSQIVLRNLFRLVDILPSAFYLLGGIFCGLTKRCQRLGDIAAGTVVVREVQVGQPEIDEILNDTENSFARLPHLEGRLRQNATPEEARIALDAVLRRNELGHEERLNVFRQIADHFRELVEFPEEITLGLSDEQYVRNVVDTLYRRAGS